MCVYVWNDEKSINVTWSQKWVRENYYCPAVARIVFHMNDKLNQFVSNTTKLIRATAANEYLWRDYVNDARQRWLSSRARVYVYAFQSDLSFGYFNLRRKSPMTDDCGDTISFRADRFVSLIKRARFNFFFFFLFCNQYYLAHHLCQKRSSWR